jgi:Tfp pilus assembly protein PilN
MFAVPLVIAVAMVGIVFRERVGKVAQIEKQLELEKERGKILAGVAPQSAEYDRLLRALEERVNTIQGLQDSRIGPVELMRAVGKLATQAADVDLNSLSGEDGRLVLRGRCRSVEAVTRFLTALQGSRSFSHVELGDFYRGDERNTPTYHFAFYCDFSPH